MFFFRQLSKFVHVARVARRLLVVLDCLCDSSVFVWLSFVCVCRLGLASVRSFPILGHPDMLSSTSSSTPV